jgi:hypothetical protein
MRKALVIDYLKSAVAQARYWAEAILDPEDDCPAFREHCRAILKDALTILRQTKALPARIEAAFSDALVATFSDPHLVNERLQHLTELLQALEAEIALEEVSRNASEAAKAAATTTD